MGRRNIGRVANLLFLGSIAGLILLPTIGLVGSSTLLPSFLTEAGKKPQAEGLALPQLADQFIASNHGFRDRLINLNARLRRLGGELPRVAFGSDGYLFVKDDDVFSQITGQRLDRASLLNIAEFAAVMHEEAQRSGRQFVVLLAPNSHTIYRRYLPVWARPKPVVTERELLVAMLRERGVAVVDPTDELLAKSFDAPVYWRSDTHWNRLGMAISFDAVMRALQRPDAAIDPDRVFSGMDEVDHAGDLVRIAGLGEGWPEVAPREADATPFARDGLEQSVIRRLEILTHRAGGGAAEASGPKILMLGNSFTQYDFDALFMRMAGEYKWMHHRFGGFDWRVAVEFDADIVILECVERWITHFRKTDRRRFLPPQAAVIRQ